MPPVSPAAADPRPHVVVPNMAGIGNALMTVPLVRQLGRWLRNAHGGAGRLTVLARTGVIAEIFRRLPEVDDVHVTGTHVGRVWRAQRGMHRPDWYVIPFPSNRWQYSLLAATAGAGTVVQHDYPIGRWRALHGLADALHPLPGGVGRVIRVPAERGVHDVRQNLALLRPIGVEPDLDDVPTFDVSTDDSAAGGRLLSAIGLPEDLRPIVIHAGCGKTVLTAAKRWPAESFGLAIRDLHRRYGRRVVLVEGPDERDVSREIIPHAGPIEPYVLPLLGPIGEAAGVLSRAECYLGSDSGLAHLSAAVGTPAVTLFAPADPTRVCPYGNDALVVRPTVAPHGAGCRPCLDYPLDRPYPRVRCRPPFCIEAIRVHQVIDAIGRAIGPGHSEGEQCGVATDPMPARTAPAAAT